MSSVSTAKQPDAVPDDRRNIGVNVSDERAPLDETLASIDECARDPTADECPSIRAEDTGAMFVETGLRSHDELAAIGSVYTTAKLARMQLDAERV